MTQRFLRRFRIWTWRYAVFGFAVLLVITIWWRLQPQPRAETNGLADEFGVQDSIPSIPKDEDKQKAMDRVAQAGFGWVRHDFSYEATINYANYDTVQKMAKASGLRTLGVLTYPGPSVTHDQWKQYVQAVTAHYSDVTSWEVMNEIDNYLSPADYVVYLKEAYAIIKANNASATIVLSGITSRPESVKFWDGIAAAGGWESFDVIGLHHYHRQNPEKVNFGGGDLVSELSRPIATMNRNGGNKKIWVTEIGYIDNIGRDNQANWLARTLVIGRSIPEIEKMFIYRLTDYATDHPFGLTDNQFNPYPVYYAIQSVMRQLTSRGTGVKVHVEDRTVIDNFPNLDGWSLPDSSHGSAVLKPAGGTDGSGMEITYRFTANPAYVVIAKSMLVDRPQAIATWFYGDDANNIWKYRFSDAKGETFQADLGTIPAGWTYKQFVLGVDAAMVSWGGDGTIDYPITFNSIVVDRQGGKDQGVARVDELTLAAAHADLFAYNFQGRQFFWKTTGSEIYNWCGQSRSFEEKVQFLDGQVCGDKIPALLTAKATPSLAEPKKKTRVVLRPRPVASLPRPRLSPVPNRLPVSSEQTTIVVHGEPRLQDGFNFYDIDIGLRDSAGDPILDQKPILTTVDAAAPVRVTDSAQTSDYWRTSVAAERVGAIQFRVEVNNQVVKNLSLNFVVPAKRSQGWLERLSVWWLTELYRSPVTAYIFVAWLALTLLAILASVIWLVELIVRRHHWALFQSLPSDLRSYIEQSIAAQQDDNAIINTLMAQGWSPSKVRLALDYLR